MQYSFIFFFILFSINNLLHLISEKVIIVIFITFLYFLIKFVSNLINNDFSSKVEYILNDINMYMNAVFNFLYINKLIYLNFKQLNNNFFKLTSFFLAKISKLKQSLLISSKFFS
jgi:hypothetical protein